ncbi:helix-turn-helix domain-containing protein [Niveispirillum sp. SYP-B3756]|uniref:helix-turn-helix domain-containing protein n=1 Tax=Niveispirillum sp. SYP-B3756 TaxID=2662178 RepID=UPI0012914564|nr:helix-turn-helix domain-containing protein [Niveispirillum sp. SYP-B3756]MQP68116.1 helix-turn-helix domain-containing protein [Niveispirillum sp. SYP-B3756]
MQETDFARLHGSAPGLRSALEDMLRLVLKQHRAGGGAILLQGAAAFPLVRPALLRMEWRAGQLSSHWGDEGEEGFDGLIAGAGSASRAESSFALAGQPAGRIWLRLPGPVSNNETAEQARLLAEQSAFLLQRHATRLWTLERWGYPWMLAGGSEGMRLLDGFIQRAAGSRLPVLLRGEFGTETPLVAAAIHACGTGHAAPFLRVQCTGGDNDPRPWLMEAAGGTLFLMDVEKLPLQAQERLAQQLATLASANPADSTACPPARLIASITGEPRHLVAEGALSRALLAELDYLTTTIPPLRQRLADIRALLESALERHGQNPAERLGEELVTLAGGHDWPDNWRELERFVARLSVMAAGPVIGQADIRQHAAWVLPTADRPADPVTGAPVTTPWEADTTPPPAGPPTFPAPPATIRAKAALVDRPGPSIHEPALADSIGAAPADHWVAMAINPDPALLQRLHPSLRRALTFLGRAYAEPISLAELASQAHASASHLSFLFRTELGLSTRTLLNRIRIQKAQEVLRNLPRLPVTEVALQVGFSDLSHFEKNFRRFVGLTPGQYRRGL